MNTCFLDFCRIFGNLYFYFSFLLFVQNVYGDVQRGIFFFFTYKAVSFFIFAKREGGALYYPSLSAVLLLHLLLCQAYLK